MRAEEFRDLFEFAVGDDAVGSSTHRGDHDLNPGIDPPSQLRPAAVLVPVVVRRQSLNIILTKRSEDLPVHPGQVSFPGGGVEEEDRDAVHTALREAEEEIGLDPGRVEVLGQLDVYKTRTGFEIFPVVGLLTPPFDLTPEPGEVAEIFEIPLTFIMDRNNHQRHSREWQGTTRQFFVFPHDTHYIWGATAGMLVNLADMLDNARATATQ